MVAAAAGVGVLGWNHAPALLPYGPDVVGAALVVGGLGAAASARSRLGGSGGGGGGGGAPEESALEVTVPRDLATGEGTGVELEVVPQYAAQNLEEEVEKELLAGASPRRVRQRLSPKVWVVDWDVRPAPVSFLLATASPYDEVVVRITSPGARVSDCGTVSAGEADQRTSGPVSDYGLAAAQLGRLRSAGLPTTACVDLVAASGALGCRRRPAQQGRACRDAAPLPSGGYMMACVADKLLAAPFAYVGSIGVVGGSPNVLERAGVEVVQRTSGRFKRSLQQFEPNTPEGLQKYQEEIDAIHAAFKATRTRNRSGSMDVHVSTNRPSLDIEAVATGESWLALHALDQGLVDGLCTADAYLRTRSADAAVLLVRAKPPRRTGLAALLSRGVEGAASAAAALAELAGAGRGLASQLSSRLRPSASLAGQGLASGAASGASPTEAPPS
ncbi:hypothetical protein EMIHUDRAFT_109312 [Emiliania huxleyi CCMP1516]|uniref:Peptidase S49 domain-containing protein n=2 Tax=Emiliania huxleyi TaxID=2903 RepID=A0A0D3KSB0_EMIH1|nr:hypothetical protein EMIHUDRAFT_109312 [Emiliania huxleyi CCMP1516]EOD38645.1 hypothetical protein EMIHUDRAFT_109312 [Emiliania huxleyi CCMP1516]|eukprot:XP_005791074.1 hypothetical protein EMIHUDRAFT_109312 [Emiliania huxleyi CCMP1516]